LSTYLVDGMAVEVDGTAQPDRPDVICIHGLGGSSNTWTPLMAALSGHRVLRIDLPGSARSAGVAGALSIQRFVDAVLAVCEHFEVQRAHLLGHSMGTIVCQHLAVQQPQLVASLALLGPLVCPPEAARPNILTRAHKAASEGVAGMQLIADAIVAGATSASTKQKLPAVVALVRESVMRQDAQGYSRSCDALAAAQSATLEAIQVPVLLLTGSEDGVAPPAAVDAMANRLSKASVQVFAGCGHWTSFERPDECAAAITRFLEGTP
jgi:3-oxoadipate enol-lactonase